LKKFKVALARVGDAAELAADILAQISFQMQNQISDGIGDAGRFRPQCGVAGERAQLLREARQVAPE